MPETPAASPSPAPVADAPGSALPPLLVDPPWVRFPPGREPIVLKGLKLPKDPPALLWAPGEREAWLDGHYADGSWGRLPDDTDWEAAAETLLTDGAMSRLGDSAWRALGVGLIMQAPDDLAHRLMSHERVLKHLFFRPWIADQVLRGVVARHGLAAYPLAMRVAQDDSGPVHPLDPFLGADVAQVMIKALNDRRARSGHAGAWFERHGPAAVPLVLRDALRRPGPKRVQAEQALLLIGRKHGHAALVDAARGHGAEAVQAMRAFRTDPQDLYPDPLPELGEEMVPERLPQILLRGRERALPASATRHFITMLSISSPDEPYPGVDPVVALCDPESLAEFAWALFAAERGTKRWASPGVRYALARLGDDETAARLAAVVARWERSRIWEMRGTSALQVFTSIGTERALRHLERLAQKAADADRIRPGARAALDRIAEERGLSPEQLADRLVSDLGLDADGGMALDYGPRAFRVGFDEQLKPYVTDGAGKLRKAPPKPGAKDDPHLALAAHKRFTDLKKEARTVAADQIRRLEHAMVTGRTWTPEEFRAAFLDHPLLRHVARRLVWTADGRAFRIAEDRTFADARDEVHTHPSTARIALPHPLRLGEATAAAWAEVFADYEILQPFPQLGRPVHAFTEEESAGTRLTRFEGVSVPNGPLHGLARQGWRLSRRESDGFQRQIVLDLAEDRRLVISLEPGIRVIHFEENPVQELAVVSLHRGRSAGEPGSFGDLDPVAASEALATLIRLTGGN